MKLKGIESELAESLIAEGHITEASLISTISKNPPLKIVKAIEMMHLLLCHKNHNTKECEYYSEDDWEMAFHVIWVARVVELMGDYTVDQILDALFNVKTAVESLKDNLSIDLFNQAFTPIALSTILRQDSPPVPELEE
ncbi:hypothetical protein KAR91_34785 [Candidatus Pacearchaeota archaeon]|nr:hypothetical protein [Candidatus Pacearchaeota archaeon]